MTVASIKTIRLIIENVNINSTNTELIAKVNAEVISLSSEGVSTSISRDTVGGVNFVTVDTSYEFGGLVKLVGLGTITLTGKSRIPYDN